MDRTLPDHAIRAFAQQTALFALLKTGIPTAPPETAWRALTSAAARTLGVRRASHRSTVSEMSDVTSSL